MEDALTRAVLDYQAGTIPLDVVRNQILIVSFEHLRRYRKKSEDEVSEFVLDFYDRIAGLLDRFRPVGPPFRHYLLRCLRWRWNTFRAVESRRRRLALLAWDTGWGDWVPDQDEPSLVAESPVPAALDAISRRRLVLLALKAAPYLEDAQLEEVSRQSGVDLAWLQACQTRLRLSSARRRDRWDQLAQKRSEAYCRRVQAEDDAAREPDPGRRQILERRARMYRSRLESLTRQQRSLSTAPTHREVARVVGMPKGTVDSGLYHLKRQLTSGVIDDHKNKE